jgi:hypothetical protein
VLNLAGSVIKGFAKSLGASRYDYRHRQEALRAVATIETYNNTRLTDAARKCADDYAVQVLGAKAYAPWLYVYALVSGEFKEGWDPRQFLRAFGLSEGE